MPAGTMRVSAGSRVVSATSEMMLAVFRYPGSGSSRMTPRPRWASQWGAVSKLSIEQHTALSGDTYQWFTYHPGS